MKHTAAVFGLHAVRALLERSSERVDTLLVQAGRRDDRLLDIVHLAERAGVPVETCAAVQLDTLCPGARHQGVVARVRVAGTLGEGALDELLEQTGGPSLLLALDGVQDPHNLGACLRTADAAGAAAVIVPRDRAAGLSATVRKVASGAAEHVPLIHVVNLARTLRGLRDRGYWIVGADAAAERTVYEADLKGPLVIVTGAEGSGLRRLTREHCDLLVRIPMSGTVASLNVSVATGVLLFEALRQRSL
jgi:23S rRNA (guanosine2251-2'-O)-methyltransferase